MQVLAPPAHPTCCGRNARTAGASPCPSWGAKLPQPSRLLTIFGPWPHRRVRARARVMAGHPTGVGCLFKQQSMSLQKSIGGLCCGRGTGSLARHPLVQPVTNWLSGWRAGRLANRPPSPMGCQKSLWSIGQPHPAGPPVNRPLSCCNPPPPASRRARTPP